MPYYLLGAPNRSKNGVLILLWSLLVLLDSIYIVVPLSSMARLAALKPESLQRPKPIALIVTSGRWAEHASRRKPIRIRKACCSPVGKFWAPKPSRRPLAWTSCPSGRTTFGNGDDAVLFAARGTHGVTHGTRRDTSAQKIDLESAAKEFGVGDRRCSGMGPRSLKPTCRWV